MRLNPPRLMVLIACNCKFIIIIIIVVVVVVVVIIIAAKNL